MKIRLFSISREKGHDQFPRNQRRGLILPFVLVLVVIMLALGGAFLYSTVQSKNIFQVFYRDDLSRLIAESAVAEWRGFFQEHLASDNELRAMIANP